MTQVIDIEQGKRKAKTRFVLHIIFVIVLTAGVIAGSLLLLFLSSLDYIPNLIITIVLDILLVAFLLFYFFNIFPIVSYYNRLFKGMNTVSLERRRKMTFVEAKDIRTISNVNLKVFAFSYKEGENEYIENLYTLESDIPFEINASYTLDTYQNIIVRYQEVSNATI